MAITLMQAALSLYMSDVLYGTAPEQAQIVPSCVFVKMCLHGK